MRFNVDQTIDHPPVITIFYGWYGYHSQSWVIYGIVLALFYLQGGAPQL